MHISHRQPWYLFSVFLASCATPASDPPRPTPIAATLQPGCLLPSAGLLQQTSVQGALLSLAVDESGHVTASNMLSKTGSPEVDAALLAAAARCRFTPAYIFDVSLLRRVNVSTTYQLKIDWPRQGPMIGPKRCLNPDYPHTARWVREAGHVTVFYRLDSASGKTEFEVPQDSSAAMKILGPISVKAVSDCLAHKEVAAELTPDKWMSVNFEWRLD